MPDASHLGRTYRADGQIVDGDRAAAFAQAIAGADPVPGPAIVPPTFAAVYCLYPTLFQLFADGDVGINLAGLIHGEQSFAFPTPVRAGDVVDATAEIISVDVKRGMTFLGLSVEATRQGDGALVCTGRSLMIIRGGEG
jgi:acyl dehydratase